MYIYYADIGQSIIRNVAKPRISLCKEIAVHYSYSTCLFMGACCRGNSGNVVVTIEKCRLKRKNILGSSKMCDHTVVGKLYIL
jgi:hypothetical protein